MKQRQLIETKNVRAVKNAVRDTVNRNGFLAVVADIGSGKTRICSELVDFWRQYPHKFAVVKTEGFKHRYSRISAIMEFLIEELSPGTAAPLVIEKKYRALSHHLRDTKKKVILIADEAQDFSLQTFRDLKKIHEITGNGMKNLFSIILFGKTDRQWSRVFAMPELGFRMRTMKLEDLSGDEVIQIAEKSYLLKFQNERVKERFAASLHFKTPLGVEFASRAVKMQGGAGEDDPVTVTTEIIQKLPFFTIKYQFRILGIKQKEFAQYANEMGCSRKINDQRVSELLSGRIEDNSLESELSTLAMSMIHAHFTNKHAIKAQ
jgi:hypothetical protein